MPCNLKNLCREFGLDVNALDDAEGERLGNLIFHDPVVSLRSGIAWSDFIEKLAAETEDYDAFVKATDAVEEQDFTTAVVKQMTTLELAALQQRVAAKAAMSPKELQAVVMKEFLQYREP